MDSLSTAGVEFCLDVLKELNSNSAGDNVFFSPLSLLYALHMILLGAGGNSAEQIRKVWYLSESPSTSPLCVSQGISTFISRKSTNF